MNLFEFTFALNAVILGLALTQIAASVHALLLAGRRVRWAPEPVLLLLIVMLVIIVLWVGAWRYRETSSVSIAWIVLQVSMLMSLYFTAASCLPDVTEGRERIDTLRYYDDTRALTFGSLIVAGLLSLGSLIVANGWPRTITVGWVVGVAMYPALYLMLIFVRARWVNIAVLAFVLAFFGWTIMGVRIAS